MSCKPASAIGADRGQKLSQPNDPETKTVLSYLQCPYGVMDLQRTPTNKAARLGIISSSFRELTSRRAAILCVTRSRTSSSRNKYCRKTRPSCRLTDADTSPGLSANCCGPPERTSLFSSSIPPGRSIQCWCARKKKGPELAMMSLILAAVTPKCSIIASMTDWAPAALIICAKSILATLSTSLPGATVPLASS